MTKFKYVNDEKKRLKANIIYKTSRDLFQSKRAQWIENNEHEVINNKDIVIESAVLAGPVTFPHTITVTGTLVIV